MAIKGRRAMGSRVTGVARKPEEHGYRCHVKNPLGNYVCPPGPDGQPKLISGFASEAACATGFEEHLYRMHPTEHQRRAKVKATPRPVMRRRSI